MSLVSPACDWQERTLHHKYNKKLIFIIGYHLFGLGYGNIFWSKLFSFTFRMYFNFEKWLICVGSNNNWHIGLILLSYVSDYFSVRIKAPLHGNNVHLWTLTLSSFPGNCSSSNFSFSVFVTTLNILWMLDASTTLTRYRWPSSASTPLST